MVIAYARRMWDAGHREEFRGEIIRRSITKYFCSVENDEKKVRPMYRNMEERESYWRSIGGKPTPANWFKRVGCHNTMTIPATENTRLHSVIRNVLHEGEGPRKMKTLCQESGGIPLKRVLVSSDPWRMNCTICRLVPSKEQKIPCHQANIGYGAHCNRSPCKEGDLFKATYQGESSRSGFSRINRHWELYKRQTLKAKSTSWMWEHTSDVHEGIQGPSNGENDYKPVVYKSFRDPLTVE